MKSILVSESTKATKIRRDMIIMSFFDQVRNDGSWKKYINPDGTLRLTEVRKQLGVLEGGDQAPAWNEDYFKSKHSSYIYRQDFEIWVKAKLASPENLDSVVLHREERDLSLPPWLDTELISDAVRNLIIFQAKRLLHLEKKVAKMQSQINSRNRRGLEPLGERGVIANQYHPFFEDFPLGIRTLRYD